MWKIAFKLGRVDRIWLQRALKTVADSSTYVHYRAWRKRSPEPSHEPEGAVRPGHHASVVDLEVGQAAVDAGRGGVGALGGGAPVHLHALDGWIEEEEEKNTLEWASDQVGLRQLKNPQTLHCSS